jgi:hypothetical protein
MDDCGVCLTLRKIQSLFLSRGVDKVFKTLAKLASRPVFSLAKSKNNWPKIKKGSVRKKTPRQS